MAYGPDIIDFRRFGVQRGPGDPFGSPDSFHSAPTISLMAASSTATTSDSSRFIPQKCSTVHPEENYGFGLVLARSRGPGSSMTADVRL